MRIDGANAGRQFTDAEVLLDSPDLWLNGRGSLFRRQHHQIPTRPGETFGNNSGFSIPV